MPRRIGRLNWFWVWLLMPAPLMAQPAKIVLIAGTADPHHPPGTHEYRKTVALFYKNLVTALPELRVEAHFQGWPRDESTLDDAATIVVVSSGADRRLEDHPLLVAERWQILGQQMRRGCGLVAIHWTTFLPTEKFGDQVLEWLGGHFDYQTGPGPRRWASAIQTFTCEAQLPAPAHPICRGVTPFTIHDEFYYQLRFRPDDPRLTPILRVPVPRVGPQTVAWALQRDDGGRAFGTSAGHFFANWKIPAFRKLALNAIVWTARVEVPAGGIPSEFDPALEDSPAVPAKPAPPPDQPYRPAPVDLADWTPRPATGPAEAWEKAGESDWVDARFRWMDTGPFFNATFQYPLGSRRAYVFRGTAVRLAHGGMLFDRGRLRWACGWKGGYVLQSDRRFGLMNTPSPDGQLIFATDTGPGFAGPGGSWDPRTPATLPLPETWGGYRGLQLVGDRVGVEYRIGSTPVRDTPEMLRFGNECLLTRIVELPGHDQPLSLLLAEAESAEARTVSGVPLLVGKSAGRTLVAAVPQAEQLRVALSIEGKRLVARFAAQPRPRRARLCVWSTDSSDLRVLAHWVRDWAEPAEQPVPSSPPLSLPARWEAGNQPGPFQVDNLQPPFNNPARALLFLTGVDFLPDGTLAVTTCHGDVWLVRSQEDGSATWTRYATGLYQPLGIKVIDGVIHVLERGQITRLQGRLRAERLENFCDRWHTGADEHAYEVGLETDPDGWFYIIKGGELQLPNGGTLFRVSRDGGTVETYCTGFRHPIGLGMSPRGEVSGADQEGNWMPATRIDLYRPGGFYGDMRAHRRPEPPTSFDPPLCWLPREVDNSAGGQVWVPAGQWGPLAGQLLHLSYGRCKPYLLIRHRDGNKIHGAAVDLGVICKSGIMRGRFHPRDGHLYVVGLNGWQTAAKQDGCLQRIRYTGQPLHRPIGWEVTADGIVLHFDVPLDQRTANNPENYRVAAWNYLWSKEYGSPRFSAANPGQKGQDTWPIQSVRVSANGRSVFLSIPQRQPVMQVQVAYRLQATSGTPIVGSLFGTMH